MPNSLKQLNIKIAVVGAGGSGITAAHRLRKLGYQNVTIFEAGPRIGGKSKSLKIGDRVYELGTVWVARQYYTILRLAKEAGVEVIPFKLPRTIRLRSGKTVTFAKYRKLRHSNVQFLVSLLGFFRSLGVIWTAKRPGLFHCSRSLGESMEDFVTNRRLLPLFENPSIFMSACGYGFPMKMPAIYMAKLCTMMVWGMVMDFLNEIPFVSFITLYSIKNGYQHLWEEIAKPFNVKLSCPVEKIEAAYDSTNHGVRIHTRDGVECFDRVIISTGPKFLQNKVNIPEQFHALLKQVKTFHLIATLFEAKGLPKGEVVFVPEAAEAGTSGSLRVFGNYPENDVYIAYQLIEEDNDSNEAVNKFHHELVHFGAKDVRILAREIYEYFPHVDGSAISQDFYQKLEQIQGLGRLYFIGGLFGFESIETVAAHSENVVDRYF
jgi:oxygen-dependent protoporphyrinogen oxidase